MRIFKFFLGIIFLFLILYYLEYLYLLSAEIHDRYSNLKGIKGIDINKIRVLLMYSKVIFPLIIVIVFLGFSEKLFLKFINQHGNQQFGNIVNLWKFHINLYDLTKFFLVLIFTIIVQILFYSVVNDSSKLYINPWKTAERIEEKLVLRNVDHQLSVPVYYYLPTSAKCNIDQSALEQRINEFFINIDTSKVKIKFDPEINFVPSDTPQMLEILKDKIREKYDNFIEVTIQESDSIEGYYNVIITNHGNVVRWIKYKHNIPAVDSCKLQTCIAHNISNLIYFSFAQFMGNYGRFEDANKYYWKVLNSIDTLTVIDTNLLASLYYNIARNYQHWTGTSSFQFQNGFDFINKAKNMVMMQDNEDIYVLSTIYLYYSFDEKVLIGKNEYYPQELLCRNIEKYLLFKSEWKKYKIILREKFMLYGLNDSDVSKKISKINDSIINVRYQNCAGLTY